MAAEKEVTKEFSSQENMRQALDLRDKLDATRKLLGLPTSTVLIKIKMAARDEGQRAVEKILGPIDFYEPVVPGVFRRVASYNDYASWYITRIRIDRPIKSEKEILTEIYKDLMDTIRLREIPQWNGKGPEVKLQKIGDVTHNNSLAFHVSMELASTDHKLLIKEEDMSRGKIGMSIKNYQTDIRDPIPFVTIIFGFGEYHQLPPHMFKQAVQIAEEVAERAISKYENPLIPLRR